MAALLRTARLLLSHSHLLHIPGTRRSVPLLGRVYSGAVGGRRTEICSREISRISGSLSRNVGQHAAALENRDETGVWSSQAQHFDWALNKMDSSVKRTGRITKDLLLRIFNDICRTGHPSGNQILLLLRSCGSLLPEVPVEERNKLAHRVWDKLQELGARFDVSHYNALLKVYLQNDFRFSPTDFLAKMEEANIQPNRVTYQRLIAAYCQTGDIEGASTILGFVKSKNLPITEAVFSSLVTGHARAGDIDSAANILSVMRESGIEPGPDTYVSLLNAYAERGDLDSMNKTLEAAESADCSLMDQNILQVISTLAKAGHHQHIPAMIELLRHDVGFVPDAMNTTLNLITEGHEDIAFSIIKSFPLNEDGDSNTGNFFLKHCINMDKPLEKVVLYCKELEELKLHSAPLTFALLCALEANKTAMALELMEKLKERNFPIRLHYFWPLLTQQLKENNVAGVIEVVKGMEKLGVTPDQDTVYTYILPVFSDIEAAQQALKNAGISVESESLLVSEVRTLAMSDLAKLYTLLSDPSHPSLNIMAFRGSLIKGFKESSDVETMVKIFELMFTDERFCENSNPAESTSYLLYSLISNMSANQLQEQETKLRDFFNQLKAKNITISRNICKGIQKLLESSHIHELSKDVVALVDPSEKIFHGVESSDFHSQDLESKTLEFEKKINELKAENKPYSHVLRQAIWFLSSKKDLQNALELKLQHQKEMTPAAYSILISMCCHHNNVEEALDLKRELSCMDSSYALDASKSITLVKTLIQNGKIEEAVDLLKEMKAKNVELTNIHIDSLFHMFNLMKDDIPTLRRLQETIFSLGLAKPSTNLCSPLISAYLSSNDVAGALDAAMECQTLYHKFPLTHSILVALVEKGDTDLLQKALDFISREYGEMAMMYDLLFVFLQTGRYNEARKIIKTPGLKAKPGRFHWFAEKCIFNNEMEVLEQFVEMTGTLFDSDRDEMYSYIFRLCKETNNWKKAEAAWTKMQEENVIPRERTLRLLANILKSNGQEVPFDLQELWHEEVSTAQPVNSSSDPSTAEVSEQYLLSLCDKSKDREAFEMLKVAKGVPLSSLVYNKVICCLLSKGSLEDALAVRKMALSRIPQFKLNRSAINLLIITHSLRGCGTEALDCMKSMVQANFKPSTLAINRLAQALSKAGSVAEIEELEALVKTFDKPPNLSSMVFVNNKTLAHINNGDLDSAVQLLEDIYTNPNCSHGSMAYVFGKVMESGNDEALDRLSNMAERLINHFACGIPAADLFLLLVNMNKIEEAKAMLDRCTGLAEERRSFLSFVANKAQIPGEIKKIKNLMNLVPDFESKELLNSYLIKAYTVDKNLPMAKALYEQMMKEGVAVNELALKRLALLYKEAGEDVPFIEPPESFQYYAKKLKEQVRGSQETEAE
ncbi:leucine-rich PPR motif-containing protein, mitochondrial [Austrofundulus limnaeus]|uniref:Leucine-rich PPR motif-containing protein, mitochondrial n=1 Tax=Austrofundulus limnaeus TaxID=52670 RepID=A0A2I4D2G8_AUSLI|nr:PREDICTED: leucine-rich PPR motif-containing protein, mitochondrial [Austrofundulus limnaeus]